MLSMTQRQRTKIKSKSQYSQLSSKYSDDSGEESELTVNKTPFKEVPTIEKPVEEGDTLQSISIRYHCPISELKRLNNIHKENEIFARVTIKVPSKPISFALAGVHTSGRSSPKDINGIASTVDIATLQDELAVKFFNLPDSSKRTVEDEVKQVIFNSNIKSAVEHPPTNPASENVSILNEEVVLLPKQKDDSVDNRFTCSGVDGDISLKGLIVIFVVVIVIAPLVYVLYIAEHPEEYHHSEDFDHSHHR